MLSLNPAPAHTPGSTIDLLYKGIIAPLQASL
jgi:hypothetical protein